jgi:hypothetical protein
MLLTAVNYGLSTEIYYYTKNKWRYDIKENNTHHQIDRLQINLAKNHYIAVF